MRLMRPEKSWRPIVTVEVDKHQAYETVLGSDGQNPNLKETFHLYALIKFGALLYQLFLFIMFVAMKQASPPKSP